MTQPYIVREPNPEPYHLWPLHQCMGSVSNPSYICDNKVNVGEYIIGLELVRTWETNLICA